MIFIYNQNLDDQGPICKASSYLAEWPEAASSGRVVVVFAIIKAL
jgi:hypothetical protein